MLVLKKPRKGDNTGSGVEKIDEVNGKPYVVSRGNDRVLMITLANRAIRMYLGILA